MTHPDPFADALAVILAAGLGTRMRSSTPKPLHRLAGRPMVCHVLAACREAGFGSAAVVVGPEPAFAAMREAVAPAPCFVQEQRLGTAHAALAAAPALAAARGEAMVLYGDVPLVRAATMRALVEARREAGAALALLAFRPADPAQYGRVLLDADGSVARIVEWRDAGASERAVGLCNAGLFCAPAADLLRWLRRVGNANAKGEYYLTDIVAIARAEGGRIAHVEAPEAELLGINARDELAAAEAAIQDRLRCAAMAGGATLVAPETVFLSWDTALGRDVTVHPHVVFGPGVTVEDGAEIRSFSHLEGCRVGARAVVGPFARLRPGASLGADAHVGNFVELKNTALGEGAKANHLAYLGDAAVGPGANIGAGTITCNYDGAAKHRTVIGAGVFVGSNATLVAPLTLGDGCFIAAGSTITEDVSAQAMAFGRARQVEKPDRAAVFRAARKEKA
ncbi:MAG: bifunctional UDP-N-acetylglucosamine diphosphorylase/glucosamine-1-phosphate N-acetyltransferase GlmU [Acetobacteraceae bacterium]